MEIYQYLFINMRVVPSKYIIGTTYCLINRFNNNNRLPDAKTKRRTVILAVNNNNNNNTYPPV